MEFQNAQARSGACFRSAAARRRCASRSTARRRGATVGKFLGIRAGGAIVVGVITKIAADAQAREGELATCQLDLLGEIKTTTAGDCISSAASPNIR